MVEQGDIIKINGINHLALMIHLCMLLAIVLGS